MDLEGCQVSRLQFLEVGSLILRVLSVKVSILEVGSWILRAAGCQGLIFWRWGHGSWGLLGVKVSFFWAGVMDLEVCWVSRFHFLELGSWILRAAPKSMVYHRFYLVLSHLHDPHPKTSSGEIPLQAHLQFISHILACISCISLFHALSCPSGGAWEAKKASKLSASLGRSSFIVESGDPARRLHRRKIPLDWRVPSGTRFFPTIPSNWGPTAEIP